MTLVINTSTHNKSCGTKERSELKEFMLHFAEDLDG